MHSIGNDFVLVDNINQKINLSKKKIRQLSDRNSGIGFDQIIIIMKSDNIKNSDFKIRIFNSDSSEAKQCVNGIRCVFQYLRLNNLIKKRVIRINTQYNTAYAFLINKKLICVRIAPPKFEKIQKNTPNNHIFNQKSFNFLKKKLDTILFQ